MARHTGVRCRSAPFFCQAWAEAAAAGWVVESDREARRRFLTPCFFVCHPPPEFRVDNPAALVRHKLIESDWKTGRMDGLDDDWARAMERLIDGVAELLRTARRDARQRNRRTKSRSSKPQQQGDMMSQNKQPHSRLS